MKHFNVKGIITDKFKLPVGIKASDFDNEKYSGQQLRIAEDGEYVLVLKSKRLTPAPWVVQKGNSNVFFTTYKQAIDYCDMHGYVVKRGKRKWESKTSADTSISTPFGWSEYSRQRISLRQYCLLPRTAERTSSSIFNSEKEAYGTTLLRICLPYHPNLDIQTHFRMCSWSTNTTDLLKNINWR